MKISSWRIPDSIRRRVAKADPSIPARALGRMFGISNNTVLNIRREYGIRINPRGGAKAAPCKTKGSIPWGLKKRGVRKLEWTE